MYRICRNGVLVSTEDAAVFVKKQRNGTHAICRECEAEGVVANGKIALLTGENAVNIAWFSGTETISELDDAVLQLTYDNLMLEIGGN